MRLRAVAAAYALWLVATFAVLYLTHGGDGMGLQVAVMFGAVPAACQVLLLGIDWRGLVAPVKMWLAIVLVILLSYFVNVIDPRTAPAGTGLAIPAAWTPIVYTLNVVYIVVIGTLVAGSPDRRLLRSIGGLYCVFATPFLVYVDLTGEMLWGRLVANGIEPNNWGLMGLTVCLSAFARKPGPLAIAGFTVGAATILQASSREHLLALAVVLPLIAALYFQKMDGPRVMAVLAGSCLALIVVAVALDPFLLRAARYVGSDILLLNSADRGVDLGFTGRTEVWQETINLWTKAPLLGVGFRQHEQFLAGGAPAHNGYLAMLADTGLVGFIVYVVLLMRSLVASWSIQDQRTRRFVIAMIVGYIVVGFFDRRTINAGNPYGLLILMCCSLALADQSLRKADQVWRTRFGAAREIEMSLAPDPLLPAS